MPEVTSYLPGTPSWVDIGSPNIAESVAFYQGMFGWEMVDQGEESGHYTMCEIGGKPVAAIGPAMNPGPPFWTTYITVANCDDAAAAITAAGGTVVAPPFDVMDVGRMAVAMDPTGGFFSVWEARLHIGANIVNESNTLCWNELTVRDVDTAVSFYKTVFGYTVQENGDPVEYREFQINGASIAGCMQMNEMFPPEVPTHWMVYFAVDDTDAAAAKCGELGGTVMVPPFDIPIGRIAVVIDPHGATFSVIKLAGASS
jgi:uncharacterized protein